MYKDEQTKNVVVVVVDKSVVDWDFSILKE